MNFKELFYKEHTRFVLWMPVLLGIGIHIYFQLPIEPSLLIFKIIVGMVILLNLISRLIPSYRIFLFSLMLVIGGFGAAQLKTMMVQAPQILKSMAPTTVQGSVKEVETTHYGYKIKVQVEAVENTAPEKTPKQVELILRRKELPTLMVGDHLKAWVKLAPLKGPTFPGGFNFRERAFFQQIGAQGFILKDLIITPPQTTSLNFSENLNRFRQELNKKLYTLLPKETGAVAAALITGEKTLIPRPLKEAFADAGIAHVLAISGLHLSLVAGLFFMLGRSILMGIPTGLRRFPTKKIAAFLAFFGALGYLGISGASIPTQRAFIMFSLLMLAVLTDRVALSMRTIAIAAFIILLIAPESLGTPSFQLSFAAVLGLISAYEFPGLQGYFQGKSGVQKIWFYLLGVLTTTLIASVATLPFTMYYFHRFTLQSIAANLVVIPLMGFWIMPLALAALLTLWYPPISQLCFHGMGLGIEWMIHIATTVSSWPGAAMYVPQLSPGFMYCIVGGSLWMCLWQQKWRWFGLIPVVTSLYFILTATSPDIYISEDLKYVGIQDKGHLYINSTRKKTFLSESWAYGAGLSADKIRRWKSTEKDAPLTIVECTGDKDKENCLFQGEYYKVAYLKSLENLEACCAKAQVVLTNEPLRHHRKICQGPAVIIDRFDTWRQGAHSLWYNKKTKEFIIATAMDRTGHRPWSLKPFNS